jgi:putative holliday junction resolvase
MRLVGLDVGNRRIGIAVSDPTGFLASAERVLLRKSIEKDLTALAALVGEFEAEAIVVGLPLHLNGTEGAQAESVRRLGERLRVRINVPLIYWDERLSTAGAQKLLIEAGRGPAERAARLDAAAAAVILQSYLDHQRNKKQQEDARS